MSSELQSGIDPSLVFQCYSDLECREGSFCHAPSKSPSHSRCRNCRRRKRRCHRDGMCCPGNRCSDNVCVSLLEGSLSQRIPALDGPTAFSWKKGWRRRVVTKQPSIKGQVSDPCLRSADCSQGLCCARHFWARICKPVLLEGQVCTRHRKKGHQALELFQRCDCGEGLSCRTLRDPGSAQPPPSSSSSSSLSTLLSTSSSSSSRHSKPHTSLLAASSSSSISSSKARLHLCQRE
ncbi:dickkopf-related protein 2-like [Aplochiton taeniatus]